MNCIFCKIINNEIPSLKIYEDDNFISILDISPASKGHCLLISKKHCESIFDTDDSILSEALIIAKRIGNAMKKELGFDGLNILQNNNSAAGQTVFHLHIHLIPRYIGDSVNINWNPAKYSDKEAKDLAKRLSLNI